VTGIAERRMRAQHLVGKPFASAVEAVSWFGAVQSQDYPAAKWALGQRVKSATDSMLDQLFDEGAILRTHVMRPTWHFVLPEDIRWIQELTSPAVMRGLAGRHRQLGLDQDTVTRAMRLFVKVLKGRYLTRTELADTLRKAGISPDGQRLPHLLATAEHSNLITSGPRRGKQFTYALLEERAPNARTLDREGALRGLTLQYFRSHGPAQMKDFAWWSSLSMKDVRHGVELAGAELAGETIDGRDYWFWRRERKGELPDLVAHLLPNFDEFTVAYRDREALLHPELAFDPKLFAYYRDSTPMGGMLSSIVTINGRVRGAWRRKLEPRKVKVEVRTVAPMSRIEEDAVKAAAEQYGRFLERSIELSRDA
jgi:hypothetical protein